MTKAGIKAAVLEAERFLKKARAVLNDENVAAQKEDTWALFGSKRTGACRRASLDLTRALAVMRKSQ